MNQTLFSIRAEAETAEDRQLDPLGMALRSTQMNSQRRRLNEEEYAQVPTMLKSFVPGDVIVDVKCGPSHTLATSQMGKIYSWGDGLGGKLGLGFSQALCACPNQHYPKEITKRLFEAEADNNLIKFVDCGKAISLILKQTGVVKMLGKGLHQKLRFDDYMRYSLPYQISEDIVINQIAVGFDHYLMVDKTDMLWVAGENAHGCLGTSDAKKRLSPQINPTFEYKRIIDIACGDKFSVVIAESYDLTPEEMGEYFLTAKQRIESVQSGKQLVAKKFVSQKMNIAGTR